MGFDNDCILNIQSLAGEYFCPVCHLLVYPNEALQAQCTHLYCKPCLTYVVSSTHACPYDGYRVTEADCKVLCFPYINGARFLTDFVIILSCSYDGIFSSPVTATFGVKQSIGRHNRKNTSSLPLL